MRVSSKAILDLARVEGFELAGLTRADPHEDYPRFAAWTDAGHAAGMQYLTDRRGPSRADPVNLLPGAKTMLCVGKLYNAPGPSSQSSLAEGEGWIARYAWGDGDYHDRLRARLERVVASLQALLAEPFASRICIDTAPLLERSYARSAGLGWIGRNTCLINEPQGSWFLLAEVLFDFETDVYNQPPPDRCGTCKRCIEACPTNAIVPFEDHWTVSSELCISYWTIEAKELAPPELRAKFGPHIFGCDICQDVCPWNGKAGTIDQTIHESPRLDELASIDDDEFRTRYKGTPLWRTKRRGLQRNVAVALENSGKQGL